MAKFNWNDVILELDLTDAERQGVRNSHKYLAHLSAFNGWHGIATFANLEKLAEDMCQDMQRGEESSIWTIYDQKGNQLNYKCKLSVEIVD